MRALQGSVPRACSNAAGPRAGRQHQQQQYHHAWCRRVLALLELQERPPRHPRAALAHACQTNSLWPAQSRVLPQHQAGDRPQRGLACAATAAAGAAPAAAAAAAAAAAPGAQPAQATAELQALRGRLQLHNTMSRKKEHFAPRPGMGDRVQMYVCGVTVYDYSHIGHARVYVAFDVLYRLLRHLRYDVQYVRNFTDVDDKIINRAAEAGEDPLALAARFITEFHTDMAHLGCLPPTLEPRATDHIPDMVATITSIIANGHAYVLPDGDVYFDVASLPGYGRLSGRSQEDNRAGERVAVDARKRGAADFALWKAAKPGEPAWDSPWGPGRPGWHIECSSMIGALMGDVIDIHGGGRDLIFPHHENELAQSQAACGCGQHHAGSTSGSSSDAGGGDAFVRFWLHNGFVNVDSEKMSKSLGNFFTIRDVLQAYHPAALRWFLVSSQYRTPLNYTQRGLDEASDRVYYVYQTLADVDEALQAAGDKGAAAVAAAAAAVAGSGGGGAAPAAGDAAATAAGGDNGSSSSSSSKAAGKGKGAAAAAAAAAAAVGADVVGSVLSGLLDDLNTPASVAVLSAPLKALNDLLTTKAGRKNPNRLQLLAGYRAGLQEGLALLGLTPPHLAASLQQLRRLALARAETSEQQVAERIAARAAARQAKDFEAADAVRRELAAKGIMLMDAPGGTTWRPGLPE